MSAPVTWYLNNQTANALKVITYIGRDWTMRYDGTIIPAGASSFNLGTIVCAYSIWHDTFDWIVLQDETTDSLYEVYAEQASNEWGTELVFYAAFGYFNANNNEDKSNQSPFLNGIANATWRPTTPVPTFTLMRTPPSVAPPPFQELKTSIRQRNIKS